MVTTNRIMDMLSERRRELLDELDAVERAIAALENPAVTIADAPAVADTPAGDDDLAGETAADLAPPRRVTARRVMSDTHKHAVSIGKHKARHAREAAKGLARELPDDSFVPAIGRRGAAQSPRLVKRPPGK
jgi:hypothetical protein